MIKGMEEVDTGERHRRRNIQEVEKSYREEQTEGKRQREETEADRESREI
jgi:hypothetical protein